MNCRATQLSTRNRVISALIISLCLSIVQVQFLQKQTRRSQNNEVSATPSTQNETIADKNVFLFDVNTRGWQIFDSWKTNEPLATAYSQITYNVKVGNRKWQHLLISGVNTPFSYFENKAGIFANWLYTVNTNSWQTVDNGDFPPLFSAPVMIQLCNRIVALKADHLRFSRLFNLIEAWIFDTVLLNWQKIQVEVDNRLPFWVNLENTFTWSWNLKVAAVAAFQTKNNCQCNQSAFVLIQSSEFRSSMYEVRCENRNGTEKYNWIYMKSNITNHSCSRVKFIASSYSSTITIYEPALQTLWKFVNKTWINVTAVPYRLRPFSDVLQSEKFGSAISTINSLFIVFNILDKKVLNFDLKRNIFIIEDVVGNIPDDRYDVVSSVVENQIQS